LKASNLEPFSDCQLIKKDSAREGGLCIVPLLLSVPLLIECLSGIEKHYRNTLPDKGIGWPGSKFGNVQLFGE
jgi:hypothetical protein